MNAPNFASETVWVGDNLPVLRGMNDACIDLIYLDPPFNSNRNYEAPIGSKAAGAAFKDAWTLDDVDVYEHGELAGRNPAAYAVVEAARQAHGKSMMSYLIFMAVRLLEMRRVLKETGSIYLHCDPTASHYLKLLMDAVFGPSQFRNEISWRRSNPKSLGKANFPNCRDIILRYTASDQFAFNNIFGQHNPEYVRKAYKYQEADGRCYRLLPLLNPNRDRPNLSYEFLGVHRVWRWTRERMEGAHKAGLVVQLKPGAVPQYKKYLDESKGRTVTNNWDDIEQVGGTEKTGYPTQKPLALLERIIKASSNEGDMVLDPFCGCATTLVVADRLRRQWAGIDLSKLAIKLVNERIAEDRGSLKWGGANVLAETPQRTDLGDLPNYRTHRHRLYGEQEGVCAGCDTHFPFRVMEVDHILPQSRHGTDHPDNLQLLCSGCNRSKGKKTMAEWRAAQREQTFEA